MNIIISYEYEKSKLRIWAITEETQLLIKDGTLYAKYNRFDIYNNSVEPGRFKDPYEDFIEITFQVEV